MLIKKKTMNQKSTSRQTSLKNVLQPKIIDKKAEKNNENMDIHEYMKMFKKNFDKD